MMVLKWICPNCREINSDKPNKRRVICGACGNKFSVKELKKEEFAKIIALDSIISK